MTERYVRPSVTTSLTREIKIHECTALIDATFLPFVFFFSFSFLFFFSFRIDSAIYKKLDSASLEGKWKKFFDAKSQKWNGFVSIWNLVEVTIER